MKKFLMAFFALAVAGVLAFPIRADDDWDDLDNPKKDIENATARIKAGGDRDALVSAYNKRADAERELQLYGEAIADYNKIIELDKQAPARSSGVPVYYRGLCELDFDIDRSSWKLSVSDLSQIGQKPDFSKTDRSDAAIADFNFNLAEEKDWSDALLNRARARFSQGDLSGARQDAAAAKAALKTEKDKADWKEPNFAEDMARANKALHQDRNDSAAWRTRGVLRFRDAIADKENGAQEMKRVVQDFENASELDPKAPAPLLDAALAQVVLRAGQDSLFSNDDRAVILSTLDDAIKRDAKYAPALAAKAVYLLSTPIKPGMSFIGEDADKTAAAMKKENLQAREDAIALLNQAAAAEPKVAQWPALLALTERSATAPDAQKLIALYTRAADLEPSTLPPELSYVWPTIFPDAPLGDWMADVKKAYSMPTEEVARFHADMLGNRAQVYLASGDAVHALADLDASLKIQDQRPWHLLRARIYSRQKNWNEVIADASAALGEKAQILEELPDLAEMLKPNLPDSDRADAYMMRAAAYDEKGEFAHAQEDIDEALKIDPKRTEVIKGTRYDKTQAK